jgi:tripartite-type tricarboxylate transporter receptor subunit TctC
MSPSRRKVLHLLAAGALAGGPRVVFAQQSSALMRSTQPLRLVQGFPPGGAVDRVAKVLAPELARELGRPVIGEYLTGANGIRAIRAVVETTSDSDVVLFATSAIANRSDPAVAASRIETLKPVIMTSTTPMALAVRASLGIDDVPAFVRRLKSDPPLAYGSSGTGNGTHIAAADLVSRVGGNATHVPYQGAPQVLADLAGGHIDFATLGVSAALAQLPSVRVLAVTTAQRTRLPGFERLPTIAETVAPGYDISLWQAVLAPPTFSGASIDDLHRRLDAILALDRVRVALAAAGAEPVGGSPEKAEALIRAEVERFGAIVGK